MSGSAMKKSKNNQPIPNWLFAYIQDARLIFGINGPDWHFHSKMSDRPGGKDIVGTTDTNATYLTAYQEYATSLVEGPRAQETAIHEVGHVAMVEMDVAVQMMAEHLPEEVRKVLQEQYDSATERFLQRLSRSIVHYYLGGKHANATKKSGQSDRRSA
jgi:hypothetical protein